MFFNGIGRAAGVFDRLQSEVTSFYQLGLESSPADADGKQHDVKVKVNRTGLDVRAGSHVSVAKPLPKPAPRDPLAVALQQPTDVPDVPAARSRPTAPIPAAARSGCSISAEIGAPDSAAPAEWGVAINQHGKNVVTRRGRIPAGSERPWVFSTTARGPARRVPAARGRGGCGGSRRHSGDSDHRRLPDGRGDGGERPHRRRRHGRAARAAPAHRALGSDHRLAGSPRRIGSRAGRHAAADPRRQRAFRPQHAVDGADRARRQATPAILEASGGLAAVPPGRYTASAARGDRRTAGDAHQPCHRDHRGGAARHETTGCRASPVADAPVAPPAIRPSRRPSPSPATAPAGSPDEIMRRVGAYVEQYGGQASLLVGVEHYSQSVTRTRGSPRRAAGME